MSTFTTQEQIVINRGTRQSGPFCPSCERQINDDNQPRQIPRYLLRIKDFHVPAKWRFQCWQDDGCQACIDELVYDFALFWLQQGLGMMEDVAGLIADHYELDLPRKVTA